MPRIINEYSYMKSMNYLIGIAAGIICRMLLWG